MTKPHDSLSSKEYIVSNVLTPSTSYYASYFYLELRLHFKKKLSKLVIANSILLWVILLRLEHILMPSGNINLSWLSLYLWFQFPSSWHVSFRCAYVRIYWSKLWNLAHLDKFAITVFLGSRGEHICFYGQTLFSLGGWFIVSCLL